MVVVIRAPLLAMVVWHQTVPGPEPGLEPGLEPGPEPGLEPGPGPGAVLQSRP